MNSETANPETANPKTGISGPVTLTLKNLAATERVAAQLAKYLRAGDVLVLSGELGAGKTTFTKALGAALGVRPGIISPTFVLVRRHPSLQDGPDLVHVDAYRLSSDAEVDDLDLESSMDDAVTVVEWGEGRVEHLSDSWLTIRLERDNFVGRAGFTDQPDGPQYDARNEAQQATKDGEDDDDLVDDEQRQLSIQAHGPRWGGADFSDLLLAANHIVTDSE